MRGIRPVSALEIDGLQTVFFSGGVAPGFFDPSVALSPAVASWSSSVAELDPVELVSSPSRTSVTLALTAQTRQLLRMAPHGSQWVLLRDSLPAALSDLASVRVLGSLAGWPASGHVHVGTEALSYAGLDVGAGELLTVKRARLGTQFAAHSGTDLGGVTQARAYRYPCTWRRRSARLWVAHLDGAGEWRDPVCEVDGYIEGAPQLTPEGLIEVGLVSLLAALDVDFAPEGETLRLLRGWHAFAPQVGQLAPIVYSSLYPPKTGRAPTFTCVGVPVPSGPVVEIEIEGEIDALIESCLVSVGGPAYAPAVVARVIDEGGRDYYGGRLLGASRSGSVLTLHVDGAAAGRQILPGNSLWVWAVSGVLAWVTPDGEGSAVLPWPSAAIAAWNLDYSTPPQQGGAFAQAEISPSALWAAPRADGISPQRIYTQAWGYSPNCLGLLFTEEAPRLADDGRVLPSWDIDRSERTLTHEGLTLFEWGGAAAAWWQPHEPWLLVEAAPGIAPASPSTLVAEWGDGDRRRRQIVEIVGAAQASTITPGAPGVVLALDADAPTPRRAIIERIDDEGDERVSIRRVAAFDRSAAGTLLSLLRSVAGNGQNGGDDRLAWGAGLRAAQVERSTFSRVPGPRLEGLFPAGVTVRELARALAGSLGCALVERTSGTGRKRLALVRVAPAKALDAQRELGDAWSLGAMPVGQLDERTVGRVEFEAVREALTDAEPVESALRIEDADAPGAGTQTVTLYGAEITAYNESDLVALAVERFSGYAHPRIIVRGTVAYVDAQRIDPGAVVFARAPGCVGYDGRDLDPLTVARVLRIERSALDATAAVELEIHAGRRAGWAPSGRVASTNPARTQLTLDAHAYSPAGTPTDASRFAVGDPVVVVPRGDRASALVRVISGRVGDTLTVSPALPAGTWTRAIVRPALYATAADRLRAYAWQSDGATIPPGDPAQTYS